MIRLFVDSSASIERSEMEKYRVDEIIPLRVTLGDKEYLDSVNLTREIFYDFLFNTKDFPKTALPNLDEVKNDVEKYTNAGDEVIVLTMSGGLSGTYNAIRLLLEDNKKVRVIDSKFVVGGVKIIINEINKLRDNNSIDTIVKVVNELIPHIRLVGTPETLTYLMRGGRMHKAQWLIGNIMNIKPILGLRDGKVVVLARKVGLNNAFKYIAESLEAYHCDTNYPILGTYSYTQDNLNKVLSITDPKYSSLVQIKDDASPVIACHWGPRCAGYFFVSKDAE